jgi:hypothetical protein
MGRFTCPASMLQEELHDQQKRRHHGNTSKRSGMHEKSL